jgi:hypothetical protein
VEWRGWAKCRSAGIDAVEEFLMALSARTNFMITNEVSVTEIDSSKTAIGTRSKREELRRSKIGEVQNDVYNREQL